MIRMIGVVIPAANEEARIGACLDAVDASHTHLRHVAHRDIDVRIVVVLDSCVDHTAAIVGARRGVESVACSVGRVGDARRIGAERVMADAGVPLSQVWLANTDADSTVPPDWLARMADEAERGAHLVLGTVLPQPGLTHSTSQTWMRQHLLREGHPHVHGANFGIRADAYTVLGGWPRQATGEDVTLAQSATRAGHLHIARTATMAVSTSTRTIGRAPRGFSSYLRALAGSA